MNDVSLTVVIPSYNQGDLLRECLKSIAEQTVRPSEIVVVDDGSTEDIAGMLVRNFPYVRAIRLDRNSGFCRAANVGAQAATTQYVFLLNNDMTLAPDCIELLLRDADLRTILTPLVLFKAEPDVIYCAGDRILTSGRPEPIGFRETLADFSAPSRVFGATGGAMLVPRAVFDRAGYFDESFVAYFEDADLCMRARWAGFDCALVPGAVAYHVGSASLGGKTWRRSMLCFRNHALLVAKNFPVPVLLRFSPCILRERFHQAGMLLSSARTEFGLIGAIGELLYALSKLVAVLPRAVLARKQLRAKTLSNREFVALLTRPDRQ